MQEAADLQHAPPAHPLAYPPARVHHALKTRLALDVIAWGGLEQVWQWRQKRVLMRPEAAFP